MAKSPSQKQGYASSNVQADAPKCAAPLTIFRFDGDNLNVIRCGDAVWVVVKRVCEALDIQPHGQAEKLKGKAWATTQMICAVAEDGKAREVFAISLDSLPMWLATIDPSKVRPEIRTKLEHYQVECARVLRDHFIDRPQAPAPAPLYGAPWEGNARGELRDDPGRVESLRRLIGAVAKVRECHWQAVHGDILRTYQVRSYARLPVGLLSAVETRLHDMIDGRVAVGGRARRVVYLLPADTRQARLPFPSLSN